MLRIEKDFLGSIEFFDFEFYGIYIKCVFVNFNVFGNSVDKDLIKVMVMVKKVCVIVNFEVGFFDKIRKDVIVYVCD